jgi:LysR family hydrogen peroxide-inducible transcriptional activator
MPRRAVLAFERRSEDMQPKRQGYNFTLRQLQYAVAVSEELSFRKAAESCGVSQPSLSAQVAQLEDALGVELFERDSRKVLPTAAAQILLERAKKVLSEVENFELSARLARDPYESSWRIGVIPTIAPYLLPPLISAIEKTYPALSPIWREDRTEALKTALQRGDLDLALLALEADLGDLETAVLGWEPFVLATERNHPLHAASPPVSLEALRGYPILLLEEGHCLRDQTLQLCSGVALRRPAFDATSLGTVTQMVAAGRGVTLLPATAVSVETQRARLATIDLLEADGAGRTIGFAWRKGSPFARVFREFTVALSKLPIHGIRMPTSATS